MRKAVLLGLAALAGIGAAPPATRANWNNTVAVTPAGTHVLGNPAAKVKLVEPKTIQRSEGKAQRVKDNRKL